jgi:type VI secretion system secreted protein Hcp
MPIPTYLTITNSSGSVLSTGSLSADSVATFEQASHKDEILVQALQTQVAKPIDPQSGQVTGVRQHKPVTFTKIVDRASPLLWDALCRGEQLTCELKYYRTTSGGKQEHYFTTKWEQCVLVDGKNYYPLALLEENKAIVHMEDWSFTYKKITWEHTVAGTSGSDDWNQA